MKATLFPYSKLRGGNDLQSPGHTDILGQWTKSGQLSDAFALWRPSRPLSLDSGYHEPAWFHTDGDQKPRCCGTWLSKCDQ